MGTTNIPVVIFGVPEPKDWKRTRRTRVHQKPIRICPNYHEGMQPHFKICPQCGAVLASRLDCPTTEELSPYEVYLPHDTPEGLDEDERMNHGHNCGMITTSYAHEDVHLGVTLAHGSDCRSDGPMEIPMPTAEQVEYLDAYLKHLGYEGPPPKLYLIIQSY